MHLVIKEAFLCLKKLIVAAWFYPRVSSCKGLIELKVDCAGAEEVAWQLSICAALLERTQVLFPAPMLDCLQTSITLVLGDVMSSGCHGHLHTYVHAHICIIKIFKINLSPLISVCFLCGAVSRQGFSV